MSAIPGLDPAAGYVVVATLALLFLHAALGKWRDRAAFAAVLANYRLVPLRLVPALAVLVPAAETVAALLLLPAATRAAAVCLGAGLLAAYGVAIGINLRRGRHDLDCGCTGPADRRPIAAWMVWRNFALAAVLATAAQPWSARPLDWTDAVTVVGGIVSLSLLYQALDRLLGHVLPRSAALRGAR
jgi:hypothetical protein